MLFEKKQGLQREFMIKTNDQKSHLAGVPDPGVEDPVGLLRPEVGLVVEAACEHLLAEGHNVGGVLQVEPLVAPHPARDQNFQQVIFSNN